MKKKWIIASYKINEVKRLERNLLNQNFDFYLPKITIKNVNNSPKEEALFPGYIFVNTNFENFSALKYTMGIKNIIKFGDKIPDMSNEDITAIRVAEEVSKKVPVSSQIAVGQDVIISNGSLKGSMAEICSLPSKERVGVFLYFLGSIRRVTLQIKDLSF